MIKALAARIQQGHRTMAYPDAPLPMQERFRGYPLLDPASCPTGSDAALSCPFGAFSGINGPCLDLGKCLFCAECSVPGISFSTDFTLAVNNREDLLITPGSSHRHAGKLAADLLRLFGRSLKFREVSAGGCNACEADTNVLSTIGWDLGRFGIQFVASPRHADGLWVTGPVTDNMKEALMLTWEAIPAPKIVVACGACAIGGGPFIDAPLVLGGINDILPVDLYIPGCPPNPATILEGLLRIIGRIRADS